MLNQCPSPVKQCGAILNIFIQKEVPWCYSQVSVQLTGLSHHEIWIYHQENLLRMALSV